MAGEGEIQGTHDSLSAESIQRAIVKMRPQLSFESTSIAAVLIDISDITDKWFEPHNFETYRNMYLRLAQEFVQILDLTSEESKLTQDLFTVLDQLVAAAYGTDLTPRPYCATISSLDIHRDMDHPGQSRIHLTLPQPSQSTAPLERGFPTTVAYLSAGHRMYQQPIAEVPTEKLLKMRPSSMPANSLAIWGADFTHSAPWDDPDEEEPDKKPEDEPDEEESKRLRFYFDADPNGTKTSQFPLLDLGRVQHALSNRTTTNLYNSTGLRVTR